MKKGTLEPMPGEQGRFQVRGQEKVEHEETE